MHDYALKFLGKIVTVTIDRPLNSLHPEFGDPYEVNAGYLPGTKAPDGEEIDAYVLGVNEPLESFAGKCVAIIHRTNDDDDKLVVVPESAENITDDEIRKLTLFQEKWFQSEIVRQ